MTYPKYFVALQRGLSAEYDVRRVVANVSNRLSDALGVRLLGFTPVLDLEGVDLVLRLFSPAGWTLFIEVQVRSSRVASVSLGSDRTTGTRRRPRRERT